MKTTTSFAVIGAWFFGNALWVLALADFVWLLVKSHTLFSWWWVGASAIGFVFSIFALLISISNQD